MADFRMTRARYLITAVLSLAVIFGTYLVAKPAEAAPFITCSEGVAPNALPFNTDNYVLYTCGSGGGTIDVQVVDPGGGYDANVTCAGGQNRSTTFINGLGGGPTAQVYCVPAGTTGNPAAYFAARVYPQSFDAVLSQGSSAGTDPTVPGGEDTTLEGALTAQRTDVISCDADAGDGCVNNNPIIALAKWAINILSAVVGVVVVAVIVFAGIEYSSSGGDPGRTAAAKGRIINAIIALVAYMFLYIILQWLIPGGLFSA